MQSEREGFHSLPHSLLAATGRNVPGVKGFLWVFQVGVGVQVLGPVLCAFPGLLSGSRIVSGAAGLMLVAKLDADAVDNGLTLFATKPISWLSDGICSLMWPKQDSYLATKLCNLL